MEEKKVIFETAKVAKEKGFNWCTRSFFNSEKDLITPHECEIEDYPYEPVNHNLHKYNWSRPTQSFLQKWLREVHNLYVESNPNASGYGWFIDKTNGTYINNSAFTGPNDGGRWDIYEEALEVGLQEALKLVPNEL